MWAGQMGHTGGSCGLAPHPLVHHSLVSPLLQHDCSYKCPLNLRERYVQAPRWGPLGHRAGDRHRQQTGSTHTLKLTGSQNRQKLGGWEGGTGMPHPQGRVSHCWSLSPSTTGWGRLLALDLKGQEDSPARRKGSEARLKYNP